MASAPKLVDLKTLLQGGAIPTHSAGGARPYVPPVSLPVKGHDRIEESQKVLDGPTGLEAMKAALNKASSAASSLKSNPAPVAKPAATAPAAPVTAAQPTPVVESKPKIASGSTSKERWVNFVELLRQDDALFAAKVENLLFVKEEGKLISLGVPVKLAFLKDQMADAQVRKKLQGFIDSYWGAGYSFEVLMSRDQVGESAQAIQQKKVQMAEEDLRNKIIENPMVKAAQTVFKGQIKSIVELNKRGH
ncbi:hypothetical protein [Bdellovibrio bacteriovorus]|uniref:hypothetical protein n=1 Tax=Bdellovibrio bacteriovorus TaxID=959 RepID=UPI0035A65014